MKSELLACKSASIRACSILSGELGNDYNLKCYCN